MPEKKTLTYDQLLDGVDGFEVDKHQTFDDTGTIVVTQPASVVDSLVMRPGSQLNYTVSDQGRIESYSTGPNETSKSEDEPKITKEELAAAEKHVIPPKAKPKKQTGKVKPATEKDKATGA